MCKTDGYCVAKCGNCTCYEEEEIKVETEVVDLCPHCGNVEQDSSVCSECGRHKE